MISGTGLFPNSDDPNTCLSYYPDSLSLSVIVLFVEAPEVQIFGPRPKITVHGAVYGQESMQFYEQKIPKTISSSSSKINNLKCYTLEEVL